MKKCPQCLNSFGDEYLYCLNDGTPLVDEPKPTVAFNYPLDKTQSPSFVVNLEQKEETPTLAAPFPQIKKLNQPTPTPSNTKKYLIALFIGLLIGGSLVAAAYFVIKNWDGKDVAVTSDSSNSKSNDETNRNENSSNNSAATSGNASVNIENSSSNSESKNTNIVKSDINVNTDRKSLKDNKYNGRVIMINAYVRSAPDLYASEVDVLPMDDRLIIGRRASPESPWYRVTCEHGTTGWMHGNTIEFTR